MKRLTVLAALSALFFAAAPASAEYAARGLTTNAGSLDLYVGPAPRALLADGGLQFNTGGNDLDLDAGASFGITDRIELGAYILQTRLFDPADIGNPYIWGTFQIVGGSTEIGIRPMVPIPVFDSGFWVGLGIPIVFHIGGATRLETGADIRFTFDDPLGVGVFVPLRLAFDVTSAFYLGLDTGVNVPLTGGGISIPFGVFLGYTVAPGVDLAAAFRWGGLFVSDRDPSFSGGDPQVILGVNVYNLL